MTFIIFLALLGAPLLEIGVFIEVGGLIGLWSTLVLIVGTAIAGTALLRYQGLSTLARARETVARGGMPVREVADGVCLLIAGALLLTPGFVTDAVGGLLLIPLVRLMVQRWVLRRLIASGRVPARDHGPDAGWPMRAGQVIEAEYTEFDEDGEGPQRPHGHRGTR